MKKFYPKLRSIQIKTGIWTIAILVILVLGYLWLSNRLSIKKHYTLKIAFTDVMGLETGDKVMYRGMEVGRIGTIKAKGNDIVVAANVNSDIMLSDDCRYIISDSSLMGGKALQILPGISTKPLDILAVQRGSNPEGVMSLIANASGTLQDLRDTIKQLKEPNGLLDKSVSLVENAGIAVQNTEAMASELKLDISHTIAQLERLSSTLSEIVQENRSPLKGTIAETPALVQKINSTLDSLQQLSSNLNSSVSTLNSETGTAGKILNDKQLYDKLNTSLENLDALFKDIKANPKKYVKFSVF